MLVAFAFAIVVIVVIVIVAVDVKHFREDHVTIQYKVTQLSSSFRGGHLVEINMAEVLLVKWTIYKC